MWWNRILQFRPGFGLVIPLAHNAYMTERALMGFAVIVPRQGVANFTVGNIEGLGIELDACLGDLASPYEVAV